MTPLFAFRGIVKHGNNRGKQLGFPTANVALQELIPEGIYASRVIINGETFVAATFIGEAKTYSEHEYQAEAYILDFNEDIYGKEIEVQLFKKLRENERFDSTDSLVKQIEADVLTTCRFFAEL